MTERTARIDQLLQEEISRIVAREIEDPRVGFATITRVETAPDLRHAKVWVSIIGQPEERKTTFRALARAMPFVRHELGSLRLKRIPELHLELDESVERGTRVLQILDALEAGREPEPSTPGETLPTPGPVPAAEAATGADADAGADDDGGPRPPDAAAGLDANLATGRRGGEGRGFRPANRTRRGTAAGPGGDRRGSGHAGSRRPAGRKRR